MGIKWVSTYKGFKDVNVWRIEIIDMNIDVDPEVEFITKFGPTFSSSGDTRNMFGTIITSQCNFTMLVDRTGVNDFISQLVDSHENRFWIRVYRNAAMFFLGPIQMDNIRHADLDYPFEFSVTAVDPLSLLKDIKLNANFDDRNGPYVYKLTTYLKEIFALTDLSEFYSALEGFCECYVHWRSPTQANDSDFTLQMCGIDYRVFNVRDGNNTKLTKALDILEEILVRFAARIYYSAGKYIIESLPYRAEETTSMERYRFDLNFEELSHDTGVTYLMREYDDGLTMQKRHRGGWDYLPPLRAVQLTYKHDPTSANYIDIFQGYVNGTVVSGGSVTVLNSNMRFFIGVSGTFTKQVTTPAEFGVILRAKVKLGTKYLRIEQTGGSYNNWTFNTPEWTTTESYIEIIKPIGNLNGAVSIWEDILSPTLSPDFTVDSEYDLEMSVDSIEIIRIDGTRITINGGTPEVILTGVEAYLFPHDGNNLQIERTTTIYTTTNDENNSEILEIDTNVGTGPSENSHSNLFVFDGYVWKGKVEDWSKTGVGPGEDLLKLVSKEIINMRAKPIQIMDRSFRMANWQPGQLIKLYDIWWMFLSYTYNTSSEEVSGEWVQVKYEATSTTEEKDEAKSPFIEIRPKPSKGDPFTPAKTADVPISPFRPIIGTKHVGTGGLMSGTRTSIPISAAEGNLFSSGDQIIIMNMRGEFDYATVNQDVLEGDTSISIDSTSIMHDYDDDAVINYEPNYLARISYNSSRERYEELDVVRADRITISNFTLPDTIEYSQAEIKKWLRVFVNGQKQPVNRIYGIKLDTAGGVNNDIIFIGRKINETRTVVNAYVEVFWSNLKIQ